MWIKARLRKLPGYIFLVKLKYFFLTKYTSFKIFIETKEKLRKQAKGDSYIEECSLIFDFQKKQKKRGLMFDVGAGVGNTCLPFAKASWQVHCFEPSKRNRDVLSQRVRELKLRTLVIKSQALSDKIENRVPFYTSDVLPELAGLTSFILPIKKAAL